MSFLLTKQFFIWSLQNFLKFFVRVSWTNSQVPFCLLKVFISFLFIWIEIFFYVLVFFFMISMLKHLFLNYFTLNPFQSCFAIALEKFSDRILLFLNIANSHLILNGQISQYSIHWIWFSFTCEHLFFINSPIFNCLSLANFGTEFL